MANTQQYIQQNKDRLKKWQSDWYQRNKQRLQEKGINYYHNHRKERKQYAREQYQNNKSYYNQYSNQHCKDHPEIYLKSKKKTIGKIGRIFDKSFDSMYFALKSWSKSVRKRDNNQCQICGIMSDHAHHIFHKRFYPQLALNLNNGISLCIKCHNESHSKRGEK